jgi:hypothetical protein
MAENGRKRQTFGSSTEGHPGVTHGAERQRRRAHGQNRGRTLHTWLKDRTFADAYHEARATAVGQAIARLQQASGEAVDCLKDVMGDPEAAAPAKVTAAKTILEMAVKGTEIAELQRRLQALEAAELEEPDARAD